MSVSCVERDLYQGCRDPGEMIIFFSGKFREEEKSFCFQKNFFKLFKQLRPTL